MYFLLFYSFKWRFWPRPKEQKEQNEKNPWPKCMLPSSLPASAPEPGRGRELAFYREFPQRFLGLLHEADFGKSLEVGSIMCMAGVDIAREMAEPMQHHANSQNPERRPRRRASATLL